VEESNVTVLPIMRAEDWRTPIKEYLLTGTLPSDKMKDIKLIKRAAGYSLIDGVLYRRSTSSPLLKCACLQRKALIFLGRCMKEFIDCIQDLEPWLLRL